MAISLAEIAMSIGCQEATIWPLKEVLCRQIRDNIHDAIAKIRTHTLEKVHENWFDQMRCYEASRGSQMNI